MSCRPWLAAGCLAVASISMTMGCGRPESASDRHLKEMRETIARLTAEQDAQEHRLSALEIAAADARTARAASPGANASSASVRSVQLGGGPEGTAPDPNEDDARPEIRVTGPSGGAGHARARGKSSGHMRIEDSDSWRPEGAPKSSALDPEAKKSYEAALALVQQKQYERGLEGLTAFLVRWPDHPFAENAMYWRGEAYFAKAEYARAIEQFEAVLARFGAGNKAPDALLKLGMCHDKLGDQARARAAYDRLKTEFPRSDAAKRAPAGARDDSSPKGPKENR